MATQTELAELNAAIRSGAQSVSFSTPNGASRSVTYRSMADMLAARADLERELGVTRTRIRRGTPTFSRGI